MKKRSFAVFVLALLAAYNFQPTTAHAQGTAFTYQGRLNSSGNPASGSYDLTFTLFNVNSGGIAMAGPLTNSAIGVTNGLFTSTLDFGAGVFNGTSYWLEIGVRTNGGVSFATLAPRQPVTPTPYAVYSENSGGANSVAASSVSAGSLNTAGAPASGQVLTYNGSILVWANPPSGSWSLTGNAGTTPGTDFLGTSDYQPLELWVNGGRAFRLEPGAGGSANVIGGSGSSADSSVNGGTIAGGIANTVSNIYPTVSGGEFNHATANGTVIGGGYNNTASGRFATIAGGVQGSAGGIGAFIGGGGYDGTTQAGNSAGGMAATVVGGLNNNASGSYAAISGGAYNQAGNSYDTVPGGSYNVASGGNSFAAGHQAQALHNGSFVWADATGGAFLSTGQDQFDVRAEGGVRFVTAGGGMTLDGYQVLTTATGGGGGGGVFTNGWSLSGNSGTDPSVNFLGTADSAGLALRVNNSRGLRLDYATDTHVGFTFKSINVNGGYWGNKIADGVAGATIAGGGDEFTYTNQQGLQLQVQSNSVTGDFGTVGGGTGNTAGNEATVPGGYNNSATGIGSFAAGGNASTAYDGNFVWGDGTQGVNGTGANRFEVFATGGVNFYPGASGVSIASPAALTFGSATRQMLSLYDNGTYKYGIGVQTATLYQRAGTGGGFAWYSGGVHNDGQDNPGGGTTAMTLDGSGNLNVTANASVCSLSIRGGCDLAEPFQFSNAENAIPQGAVVVIDEENPGHLKLSDQPYDARVAGVVSGANGINPGIQMQQEGLIEGGKNVALTGRVYVQADTSNGDIKPGDLLTTSTTPGRAMRVSDHLRAQGAILGKAMTGLKDGQGMVLVLVTLQ